MAAQGSRKYLLRVSRYSRNQFCAVTSSIAAFTKGLLKGWKANCIAIGTIVGVTAMLMTGSMRETQANATYNYVGNAFDVAACETACFPPDCTCLDGNLTMSVVFDDVPAGYTGPGIPPDINVISITASALGFTLGCLGTQCDADFWFVNGKIIEWGYYQQQWAELCLTYIWSVGPSSPPTTCWDDAYYTVPIPPLGVLCHEYKGSTSNSPGTWTGPRWHPHAAFTFFPENPCINQMIIFDASSSSDPDGRIVKYNWDFGDWSTDEGVIVHHAYAQAGQYTVTLVVTDNEGLPDSTQRTINISDQGPGCGSVIIVQPDLAGTWYYQIIGDGTSANNPLWRTGTMTVNLAGTVIGGTVHNTLGVTDTLVGGSFSVYSDGLSDGQVTGILSQGNGAIHFLPNGSLDAGKTILTMVNSSNDFRGLFVAIKGGGTFTQADLAGTWYFQSYGDSALANAPYWASGTIIVNANGDVTGGIGIYDSGAYKDFTGGSLAIDSFGQITGSVNLSDGTTQLLPHGKLDAGKTILTMVALDPVNRGVFVAAKGGGPFTPTDLAGIWHIQAIADNSTENNPYWAWGPLSIDRKGAVIGGYEMYDSGAYRVITGGSLSIDSYSGQVTGSVNLSDGSTQLLPHGKLDAGKTTLTMVNSDPDYRGLFVAIKGHPSIVASFNAEPVQGIAPLKVNFEDTSSGVITSYLWDFGDGTTSTEQNPTHIYHIAGTYTVSVTVTGEGGTKTCTKTSLIHANALPKVTISATDPKASELGTDKGKFVIARTGDTTKPLTVYYKVTGTATNGIDYKKLSGKLVIPIGKASASFYAAPINDRIKELKETVKVTLVKKTGYQVGTPAGATVTITDND